MNDSQLGLCRYSVALQNHTEKWDALFIEEKDLLSRLLNGHAVRIEHVGSTAVTELPAKPIIDVAVGVRDFTRKGQIIQILSGNGYEYKESNGGIDRLLFVKGPLSCRTHHIHVEEYENTSWNNHIWFRDYLRSNAVKKMEYINLKKSLAVKYQNDRDGYTREKADFIVQAIQEYRLLLEEQDAAALFSCKKCGKEV